MFYIFLLAQRHFTVGDNTVLAVMLGTVCEGCSISDFHLDSEQLTLWLGSRSRSYI